MARTPTSSYLGSDLPPEQLGPLRPPISTNPINNAAPSGELGAGPTGEPGTHQPTMGDGSGNSTAPEDQLTAAHSLMVQRAVEYMGISPEEAGNMPVERLAQELRTGYPEDTELQAAIDLVTEDFALNPGGVKGSGGLPPPVEGAPPPPVDDDLAAAPPMNFRPDRGY